MSRPPAHARRDAILAAVVEVIIDIGFTEMTVADVAQRVGASTSLVHYHYDSKAALIVAALRRAVDDDRAWRNAIVDGAGTAGERLDRLLCESLPGAADDDGSWVMWIETWGEARRNADIKRLMIEQTDDERSKILRLIADEVAAERATCADPQATAARLSALRDGLAVEHVLFDAAEPAAMVQCLRDALARELPSTTLNG